MPGPGQKTKAKAKSSSVASGSTSGSRSQLDSTFIGDIDSADGWNPVINILCDYLELPDISTRSGLKKVHANFDSIYRRLDKLYTRSADNVRIKAGICGIYARLCVDSILRNKLFERGFLRQIFPLLDTPSCRKLILRTLTTITHHGGIAIRMEIAKSYLPLLQVLKDAEDPKTIELSIVTLSHCFIAALCDDGMKLNPTLARSLDLKGVVTAVTEALHQPFPSRVLVDHSVQLLAVSTLHCKVPPSTVTFLVAGLRSKDWIFRSTCLGGLIRLHQTEAEPDQRGMDPMKLIACVSKPAPSHLNDILLAYGFEKCETMLTLKTANEFQRAMMNSVSTHDLYTLGITLAGFILRTEFSISEGMFQGEDPVTGRRETMDVGLPFKMWSDALPHCAKAIRDRGLPAQADIADILDMKFYIMKQRIPDAVKIANTALNRTPGFAYAYYVLTLASDPVVGLRAAKKGMKCTNTTPFVRFQMMQRAVEHAGEMGIQILQEASDADDKKWVEGIAFLTSAMEDAKTYIAEAPPDNRHMKNVLYWYILLRITMAEEMSEDLRELQGFIRKLKIADDFSNWIGVPPPKTYLRLTQQTVVKLFSDAAEEWGEFIAGNSKGDQPNLSAEKVEDDLAAWLGDLHLEGEQDSHSQPATFSNSHVELYRCSWCGNPSAILRKCAGCSKARISTGSLVPNHCGHMSSATVPIHGNYHGYYAKRPSVNDPRLELLPPSTFARKHVLDVGCNEGKTFILNKAAQSRGALKVVGVDIDDTLVRAAWRRRRTVWSAQGPLPENETETVGTSRKRKRVDPVGEPDYFPASCAHSLGPLPIPRSSPELFPHNVSFRTADWVNDTIPEDEGGYDVVVACVTFPLTQITLILVHLPDSQLQNGYISMEVMLHSILSLAAWLLYCNPGGQFVVEPQAWETYRKAKRMDKKLRDTAQGLTIRPDDFPRMLAQVGFGEPVRLGSVGEGGFHRPVDLYTKL
ncbi:Bin3-type SAM domain-containing protein [Mycena venus]|uniref:RNA methyltransferase n=1 Tax=Mycena venus TaxID=2733690 RepID=A0A8H6XXU7_9AGAR|nr:Bin3-type SAM domain-containing protein [Mycena venus]